MPVTWKKLADNEKEENMLTTFLPIFIAQPLSTASLAAYDKTK